MLPLILKLMPSNLATDQVALGRGCRCRPDRCSADHCSSTGPTTTRSSTDVIGKCRNHEVLLGLLPLRDYALPACGKCPAACPALALPESDPIGTTVALARPTDNRRPTRRTTC